MAVVSFVRNVGSRLVLFGPSRLVLVFSCAFGVGFGPSPLVLDFVGLRVRRFRVVCSVVRGILLVDPVVIWPKSAKSASYGIRVYIELRVYQPRKVAGRPAGRSGFEVSKKTPLSRPGAPKGGLAI